MVNFAQQIRFVLNDREISATVPPGMLVLDYLRKEKQLTGTKEGCKEGDCGACTVILGELRDGSVRYTPMTSCLLPMAELQGKHLVTVEGLSKEELSPVQKAMVECGGTQCGYCTPGFVVAMTAGLMEPRVSLDKEGVLYAISGNLCRCTGYRPICEAGDKVVSELKDSLSDEDRIESLCAAGALPDYFRGIAEKLERLTVESPEGDPIDEADLILGGGTDLYVQQGEDIPDKKVSFLDSHGPRPEARLEGDRIVLDARMTFEEFARDPLLCEVIPGLPGYNLLISSWPVRTRATLAGNLCNASPIADLTCLFLALNSEVSFTGSGELRTLPLQQFYLGYKTLNKSPSEVMTEISFPTPSAEDRIHWEKVSKRAWLDIASVNAASRFRIQNGSIRSASLAVGGVAATPLYLEKASKSVTGMPVSSATFQQLLDTAMSEFSPISDVRGSARYKKLLARQLLLAQVETLFADEIEMEALYEAL